jgi:hypothetical protein
MANSKKTPMSAGQMKTLGAISLTSVSTKISAQLAERLGRNGNLSGRLKKFWDDILKEDGIESFIVGEVFQHRNANCVPQYFSDQFNVWLWVPQKHKEIIIDTEAVRKLNEYRLPENMYDTTIEKNANSKPMSMEEYWMTRYLLIVNPELGKQLLGYQLKQDGTVYIMHVTMADGSVVAVLLRCNDAEWYSDADRFDDGGDWSEGSIFLSSATAL